MKKLLLTLCVCTFSILAFAQNSDLAVLRSTDQITDIGKDVGISYITVTQKRNAVLYSFSATEVMTVFGEISLQGELVDIYESPDYINLKYRNIALSVTKKTNEVTVSVSGSIPTPLTEKTENTYKGEDLKNLKLSFVFLNEVYNKTMTRSVNTADKGLPKRIWVTIQIGQSSSVAMANLNADVKEFLQNHPGCTLYGTAESYCLLYVWGCIATQHYMCP